MELTIAGKLCRTNNRNAFLKLESFLEKNPINDSDSEHEVRKVLLPFVQSQLSPNEWILFDGNSVWDVKRLLKQFKTFIKFYDYEHFPKYLYEFFHLQCGSIAHYNKAGWLQTYPDLESLKEFFRANEYGERVEVYPPDWHYDARQATEGMTTILFGAGGPVYPRY